MKTNRNIIAVLLIAFFFVAEIFTACTKYGSGFLSPNVQYAVNQFSFVRGRTASSYTLVTDGSSIPMHVKWIHIYDSTGKVVDDLFTRKYPVAVWTGAYNAKTDVTYAAITAKRAIDSLTPIVVNETNGTIQTNSASIYLPLGTYTMDLQVTNDAGTENLKRIMQLIVNDGIPLETTPEQGTFNNSITLAGGSAVKATMFNGINNPFVAFSVTRFADTPNTVILKIADRNGVPFNPRTGELAKRPNSGLNPVPPFLQNLQDYAPDTYIVNDSVISIRYPITPFPIASLGNGFNMYYDILGSAASIDSTSSWPSNSAGVYYNGSSDSHYRGVYQPGRYDYFVRVPMRVQVPGAYKIVVNILNTTHR